MVADGSGELYTKSSAQALALACSMAGACLPGRALVEATGSLYNHHIQAANRGLSWEETYFRGWRSWPPGWRPSRRPGSTGPGC